VEDAGRPLSEAGPRRSRGSTLPPSTPEGFTFTPDGKSLLRHVSYYTGVSNVFRFDIATRNMTCCQQRLDRLLPADAAARRLADGL
jgi:hypothetical protein